MLTVAIALRSGQANKSRTARRRSISTGPLASHSAPPVDRFVLAETAATDSQNTRHTYSIVSAPLHNEVVHCRLDARQRIQAHARGTANRRKHRDRRPIRLAHLAQPPRTTGGILCGGIGITPFMSLVRQAAHGGLQQRLVLLQLQPAAGRRGLLVEPRISSAQPSSTCGGQSRQLQRRAPRKLGGGNATNRTCIL
jgi:hypothetical protein